MAIIHSMDSKMFDTFSLAFLFKISVFLRIRCLWICYLLIKEKLTYEFWGVLRVIMIINRYLLSSLLFSVFNMRVVYTIFICIYFKCICLIRIFLNSGAVFGHFYWNMWNFYLKDTNYFEIKFLVLEQIWYLELATWTT